MNNRICQNCKKTFKTISTNSSVTIDEPNVWRKRMGYTHWVYIIVCPFCDTIAIRHPKSRK